MSGILDGKEVEVKIGDVGSLSVDVSKDGMVKVELVASKELDGVKLQTSSSAEVSIFVILEKACAKNDRVWDEALIAQVKMILGMVG